MADAVKIPVQLDLQGLDASFNKLSSDLQKQCDRVVNKIQQTSQRATTAVQRASQRSNQATVQAGNQAASSTGQVAQSVINQTAQTANQVSSQIAQATSQVTSQVANTASQATSQVAQTTSQAASQVAQATQQAGQSAQQAAQSVQQSAQQAGQTAQQAAQQAGQAAQQAGNQAQQAGNQATQNTTQATQTMGDRIRQILDNIRNTFTRTGQAAQQTAQQTSQMTQAQMEAAARAAQEAAEKAQKAFADMTKKVGDNIQKVGKAVNKYISLPLLGAGTAATKFAMDFEEGMAALYTIADEGEVPMEKMSEQIRQLSNETGISATELAANVYDAISSGQSTGDAVNFVTNSAKLAKAGFAEASGSVDVLTTILNAYGMKAEEVTKVSDILIATQDKGKVTVGELSQVMGRIIPTANSVGVNLEQVATGYSIMTAKGIRAAESTTYMNSMLDEMGKSGTTSSDAIKKAFKGKSFQTLIKEGKSLGDVLAGMEKYAKKNKLTLADLFGSSTAGKAALALVTDEGKEFNQVLKEMGEVGGSTERAYEKVSATTAQKFREAFNKFKNVGMEIAANLLPPLTKLAENLAKLSEKFAGLSTEQQQAIIKFAAIGIAIGPVIGIIGKMVVGVGKFSTAWATAKATATAAATATQAAATAAAGGIGAGVQGATTAVTVGRLAILKNMGLIGKAVGLLANPWVAIPATIGIATYAVIKRTKQIEENTTKNNEKIRESVLGVEKSYQELTPSVEKAMKLIKEADVKKYFKGDAQLKQDMRKTFEGIYTFITEGIGDAELLMNNLLEELEIIAPNLSKEEKEALGQWVKQVVKALTRDEVMDPKIAKEIQDKINKMFGIKVDFEIDTEAAEINIKNAFIKLNETLDKEKSLLGWNFDIFGTKKEKAKVTVKEQLAEIGKVDPKYIEADKVIGQLQETLEGTGLSAKKQKEIFKDLGKTLATSFDISTAEELYKTIAKTGEFTTDDINEFIDNTLVGIDKLDKAGREKLIDLIYKIPEINEKKVGLTSGTVGIMNILKEENPEVWGSILSENLSHVKDAQKSLDGYAERWSSTLKQMANPERVEMANWLGEMLGQLERDGVVTKEQVSGLVKYINEQLGGIEGNEAKIEVETDTAQTRIDSVDQALQKYVGNPEFTAEMLLDESQFTITMSHIRQEIEKYALEHPDTPIDLNKVPFGESMTAVMKDLGTYKESKPSTDVLAVTKDAEDNLKAVLDYIMKLKSNNEVTVKLTTEKTEKKKVVTETVTTPTKTPAGADTGKKSIPVMQSLASAITNPISTARDSFLASSRELGGQISTASSISMPTIKKGTVDKKKLSDANKMVKTKKEAPATIETVVNLDGNVIARLISDKVDMRNGTRFIAKQRRFA